MTFLARRRGALVALAIGIAVLVLYVVLQPGDRPRRTATAPVTTTTEAPTTTIPPIDALCALARDYAENADPFDASVTARLAESFFTQSVDLAPPEIRPEYAAAADYYTEYNTIGEPYGYDLFAILGSPDGARWTQLLSRSPLGVPEARAHVAFVCQVELPPPPTVTTTTTTRPRITTSAPPDGATTVPGAPTDPGATTPPPDTAPPATAPPATAAPG